MSSFFKAGRLGWVSPVVLAGGLALLLASAPGYQLSLATQFCLNIVVLAGLNLVSGYGGQESLGHTAFVGLGAYAVVILALDVGLSLWFGLLLATILGAVLAIIVGVPTLRLRGLYFTTSTIAVVVSFEYLANRGGELTGGPDGRGVLPPFALFGLDMSRGTPMYVLAAAVAFLVMMFTRGFIKTWVGWALRSATSSESATSTIGASIFGGRLTAYAISGALGALAGGLSAIQNDYVSPTSFTVFHSIELFVALYIGGLATFWGPVLGAFLLYNFDLWLTPLPEARPFIVGAIFLLALRYLPRGIAGGVEQLAGNLAERKRRSPKPTAEELVS